MRFLSLFSGIEAASQAFGPLGWAAAAFSEIEPFPCALLKHHYPSVPNLGDVSKITRQQVDALGPIDLVCGGFPCQDLSVAGKRAGLKDSDGNNTRSGLFFDAMRVVGWTAARWLVIENVPGMLSSNAGRDFAAVVGEMAGCEFGIPPDGWPNSGAAVGPLGLVEWRTLDAQFFGLAQRRKRVFLVRDSGDWANRQPILLEPEGLRGDPPPSRGARQEVAGTVAGGSRKRGGYSADDIPAVAATLDASFGRLQGASGQDANHGHSHLIAGTLSGLMKGDGLGRRDQLLAFGGNKNSGPRDVASALSALSALSAHGGTGRHDFESETFIAFDTTQITSAENRCNPQHGDPCHPLAAGAHPPAIAFNARRPDACEAKPASSSAQVRRLTVEECELLQGFPRGYTNLTHRGKPAADGPRYKALGNSWAVPVARWVGERIDAVMKAGDVV